jgi:hypothetical protein
MLTSNALFGSTGGSKEQFLSFLHITPFTSKNKKKTALKNQKDETAVI